MRRWLGCLATLIALAAVPASAQADVPDNDNFSGSGGSIVQANAAGSVLPHNAPVQWSIPGSDPAGDIDEATTEGGESLTCPAVGVPYGKTVWYRVHPDVSGFLQVRTTGGDAVLRVMSISGAGAPEYGNSLCADDPDDTSAEEIFVSLQGGPGARYAVQVGVYNNIAWPSTHLTRITFFRDQDLDSTFDASDRCPTSVGPTNKGGCPDSDGDGLVNIDDRCPTASGSSGLRGCPDGDGDGVANVDDRCATQSARARDANRNGCLDYAKFGANVVSMPNSTLFSRFRRGFVRNGVRITRLTVSGLPSGTLIQVRCTRRSTCRRQSKRGRRATFGKLKGKRLRPGKSVVVIVSKSGYITRRFVIKAKARGKRGVSRSNRCQVPGTKRLASCSRVSTVR